MSVDDLFPEDGEDEDHPIMALFDVNQAIIDQFMEDVERMFGKQAVASPPLQDGTV